MDLMYVFGGVSRVGLFLGGFVLPNQCACS